MTESRWPALETWLFALQDSICDELARADGTLFREDCWQRADDGGGGRSRVIEEGGVFEKAGVNVSVVHGKLPAAAARAMRSRRENLPALAADARFFAAGLSMVLHPRNPHAPTLHANLRYFELPSDPQRETGAAPAAWWFGGGTDLTPCYLYEEDAAHFHRVLKTTCDAHDAGYYPRFKRWCDEYFWIRHREEARGVGGIFFDDLNDRPRDDLFAFVRGVGSALVGAYMPILLRRKDLRHSEAEKEWQHIRRGRYVEFNLIYDRGTLFGLETGARVESVLMSLPLRAHWRYAHEPTPGSKEAELLAVLRAPRDWA